MRTNDVIIGSLRARRRSGISESVFNADVKRMLGSDYAKAAQAGRNYIKAKAALSSKQTEYDDVDLAAKLRFEHLMRALRKRTMSDDARRHNAGKDERYRELLAILKTLNADLSRLKQEEEKHLKTLHGFGLTAGDLKI